MVEVISLSQSYGRALERAVEVLKEGGTIIYPTDTVYGLGCIATNKSAVEKVYSIKKRDRTKPVSVLVGNLNQLIQFFEVDEHMPYIYRYMPGPYTFIVEAKPPLSDVLGKRIGLRVPDHFFCRKLAVEVQAPIVTTSANISGEKPASSFDEIDEVLDKVDLAIDGGSLKYAQPSTVVDLIEKKIIRQGAGSFAFISTA